jgi:hypothetical protein
MDLEAAVADQFTQFDYLLNAMLHAGQQERPADHGYGEKRERLYEHVRDLERKAAAYDALRRVADAAKHHLDALENCSQHESALRSALQELEK